MLIIKLFNLYEGSKGIWTCLIAQATNFMMSISSDHSLQLSQKICLNKKKVTFYLFSIILEKFSF